MKIEFFPFDAGNFAAFGDAIALRENDIARRIDDRTAFPARRKSTARSVDIAFTPVGRQGRAVSPGRRNVYVFTVNRTTVRRVEAAGRIALGVNLNVFDSDDCIFSPSQRRHWPLRHQR